MSSIPGYSLEDLVAWQYNITVVGQSDPNASLAIAEALGISGRVRPLLTDEQFAPIVARFEEFREVAERRLDDFDEECQSWRTYGGTCFDDLFTDENDAWVQAFLKDLAEKVDGTE